MKWNRFTLKTKTEAEDIVICTLAEVGIEGVEIQDKQPLTDEDKAQMFVDIMPEGPADDGIAYLNFYLEEDADTEAILKDVKEALEDLRSFVDIGEATITESQTEDKDWINNWKQYFHQFYVDDILIVPSWEEIKEMILRHTRMQIELKGEFTGIREMRKHIAWYTAGMKHSAGLRRDSNLVSSYEELEKLLDFRG